MKIFACQHCSQLLFFENTKCEKCGHRLGYLPERRILSALEAEGEGWRSLADRGQLYRFCANAEFDVCNWLIPMDSDATYCLACVHNRTVPDLAVAENQRRWRMLELAKRRLFYALLKFRLPLVTRQEDPDHGLAFDFLADSPAAETDHVMTGHDNGLITLALAEADSARREERRQQMGESYRTLLGHFRHESGHYFWDRLVRERNQLDGFRGIFGDERQDYAQTLKAYYNNGPPPNWQERFISAYAAAHPWEDFAETWAHYLHIVDALETASAFGMHIHPKLANEAELHAEIDFEPYDAIEFSRLVDAWLPLAFAVNSLNRSLGQPDLYPFVLSPAAIEKLGFIHKLVHEAQRVASAPAMQHA